MERQQTWETACCSNLEMMNPGTGDIAICSLWTPPADVQFPLSSERINMIGPLRTASGLGWLLRGLYLHPAIRNLVVWGKDLARAGDYLIALWSDGLMDQETPTSQGRRLYPEMDREAVDYIRQYVRVWDWRGKSAKELAGEIHTIPYAPPQMQARSFPPVPLRDSASPLPSRKTTFSILADDIQDGWLQLLNLVMRCGTPKKTRNGGDVIEIFNTMVTIETDHQAEKAITCFDCGREELEAYYQCLMNVNPDGSGYSFGERLHNWPHSNGSHLSEPLNQLDSLIRRLKGDHASARGTVVLLGPADLDNLDDAPCVLSITFNILDEHLHASYVMRKDDIYAAWPLNALSLVRFQNQVSERIGVPSGGATFISHSAYVYESDWGKAWDKLDRWFKRPLPFEPDPSGLFILDAAEGQAKAMYVNHEVDKVLWEGESEEPQELVRYIVDTMPWLTRQHIRYLGEEAARMNRALKDGVKYEQG